MKILVCISKTPDTTAKIAFIEGNTKFDESGVQWIINPYDEWYALVRAIELKEKDPATLIHLVTVGGVDAEPIIRKALALGGDEAIRIDSNSNDSFTVAAQIAAVAKEGAYDLIFTGKETIDYNSACIGSMLSALLDLPFISMANHFELNGNTVSTNFEILNSIGQAIFKGAILDKAVVQTSSFAPGVYVIKLDNGKTFEFKKIIKE